MNADSFMTGPKEMKTQLPLREGDIFIKQIHIYV